MTHAKNRRATMAVALLLGLGLPHIAHAELNPKHASVARLKNGLTVLVLEEHAMPIVSVQMLYKAGARDESTGKTGLAHFMEHMAFRASKNFPNTRIASSIYDVGGEWHAYTWLDQTTYFETAPKKDLPLLLRVEADRMHNLLIPAMDVDAERGAVLAEMHGYQNDPASVLHDGMLYTVFQAHPYGENTIGWESDVDSITRADLEGFYKAHYQPRNAVLAVVGDVKTADVIKAAEAQFGAIPGGARTQPPHTIEPAQEGERRFRLLGPVSQKYFEIAWRAPSSRSPDYVAFLILQDILGAGSGVNFKQNDWGTPVRKDSFLGGIAGGVTTWYPPSAQPYVFTIAGKVAADAAEAPIEDAIGKAVARVQTDDLSALVPEARKRVLRQLAFDIETTEDAAHQLAFFEGIDALDALQNLPQMLGKVTADDVKRVAAAYLQPTQRTIGWSVPGTPAPAIPPGPVAPHESMPHIVAAQDTGEAMSAPVVTALTNGTPVILRRSPLSATAQIKLIVPGNAVTIDGQTTANDPAWGYTALDCEILPQDFGVTIAGARKALDAAAETPSADPETRLGQAYDAVLGFKRIATPAKPAPALIVVSGDVDPKNVLARLNATFGDLPKGPAPQTLDAAAMPKTLDVQLPQTAAQYEIGYLVPAPAPADKQSYAWRIALYALTHGYGGRLGDDAITRRGLVYYIDSAYNSDGTNGWITLSIGVDPDKLNAMKAELTAKLADLANHPPSDAEIAAAKAYLIGRAESAAQSNAEITEELARQYLFRGELTDSAELKAILAGISRKDVLDSLKALTSGTVITVAHN